MRKEERCVLVLLGHEKWDHTGMHEHNHVTGERTHFVHVGYSTHIPPGEIFSCEKETWSSGGGNAEGNIIRIDMTVVVASSHVLGRARTFIEHGSIGEHVPHFGHTAGDPSLQALALE